MSISALTNLYCIFGNPVKHSLSPVMHNNAFKSLNLDNIYMAFEPDNIESALMSMRTLKIKGASVTIPFKTDAIKYLDQIDPLAQKIGAINTVINKDNCLTGYNTDGIGAYKSLLNAYPEIDNSNVLIIGNGGSARAIAFTLLEKGCNVVISGRKSKSHLELVDSLKKYYNNVELAETNNLVSDDLNKINVIINTTPLGMKESDPLPINTELINNKHVVFDIVYAPHNTELLKKAKLQNASIVYGIEMLIYQGAEQFEIWTGKSAPLNVIRDSIKSKLK